jgi:hypothetical protein
MKWLAWFAVFVGAAAWASLTYRQKSAELFAELKEWISNWSKISWKK